MLHASKLGDLGVLFDPLNVSRTHELCAPQRANKNTTISAHYCIGIPGLFWFGAVCPDGNCQDTESQICPGLPV